jgi:hypothetical protein
MTEKRLFGQASENSRSVEVQLRRPVKFVRKLFTCEPFPPVIRFKCASSESFHWERRYRSSFCTYGFTKIHLDLRTWQQKTWRKSMMRMDQFRSKEKVSFKWNMIPAKVVRLKRKNNWNFNWSTKSVTHWWWKEGTRICGCLTHNHKI